MRIKTNVTGSSASIFLLIIIVILLIGGVIFAVYTLRSDPVDELLVSDRVINVLYIIEKDQKPLGTYVLMCYPKTHRMAIFDVPGELGLLLRRINRVDRIDTLYSPQRTSLFESEVENILGVDVSFSIIINTENLGKAVDLLEGVEIFIPSPVNIRDDELLVSFPSGLSRLDGDKAVSYISYNAPDEEPEMAVFRRQRFLLGFLRRQAEMNVTLKNHAVAPIYHSFSQHGLSLRVQNRLLDEFAAIDMDRVSIQAVGGNLREVSGKMLLIPHYDGNLVKEIVRQTLATLTSPTDGSFTDRNTTVEVLNGTTVTGLAGRTAEILRGFGYDIISIGNADHSGYEKTLIIDRSGFEGMADNLAGIIRCSNIRSETRQQDNPDEEFDLHNLEYRSDFTLIIGRDFNGRYVVGN